MLFDQPETFTAISNLVGHLLSHPFWREDLVQEALLAFWHAEAAKPGQTRSWYLQRTRAQLLNCLRAGRSVDSLFHRPGCIEDLDDAADSTYSDESAYARLAVDDFARELAAQCGEPDATIVRLLLQGYTYREIARHIGISLRAVARRCEKIAAQASRLDDDTQPGISSAFATFR
jgi:RNA polymerase sigma factor (sigma-70 family)